MVPDHPPVTAAEPAGKGRVHLLRPVLLAVSFVHTGLSRLADLGDCLASAYPRMDRTAGLVAPLFEPVLAAPDEPGWATARGLPAPRLPGRARSGRALLPARPLPGLGIGQGPVRKARGWLVSHAQDRPDHRSRRASPAEEESEPVAPSAAEHLGAGRRTAEQRPSIGPDISPHLHRGSDPGADDPRRWCGNRTHGGCLQRLLPP